MPLSYLVIFLGVLSVSFASILVKLSTAEPLVVAFYRLAFSVAVLGIPLLCNKQDRISRGDRWLSIASGLLLATHFATWFFSLRLTSIASSTILVSTHPFVVLAVNYFVRGERTTGAALFGVLLTVVGIGLVGWGDFGLDSRALLGDALALVGAVTVGGYFLIGREVRKRVGAVTYSATTYASASVALLLTALAWGSPFTGFAAVNWWIFLALAVFPTLFGHTLFNWALKYVPASVVSVNILGEPIGASLLAWLIWRTAPGGMTLLGSLLVLIGIGMFIRFHHGD